MSSITHRRNGLSWSDTRATGYAAAAIFVAGAEWRGEAHAASTVVCRGCCVLSRQRCGAFSWRNLSGSGVRGKVSTIFGEFSHGVDRQVGKCGEEQPEGMPPGLPGGMFTFLATSPAPFTPPYSPWPGGGFAAAGPRKKGRGHLGLAAKVRLPRGKPGGIPWRRSPAIPLSN